MTEPRISPVTDERIEPRAREQLRQVQRAIGTVPNLHRTLAHSPAALRFYIDGALALASGRLSPRLREQIAVASAGVNRCGYCAAAHTLMGKGVGVDREELARNLRADSSDAETAAVLSFVAKMIERRGAVADDDVQKLRAVGLEDADIVEVVAHIGLNFFTNAFNVMARTEVDFPRVELPAKAGVQ